MLLRVIFILILISVSSTALYAKEIPIIVISAGKSAQSYSTVGSDIEVIDSKALEGSDSVSVVAPPPASLALQARVGVTVSRSQYPFRRGMSCVWTGVGRSVDGVVCGAVRCDGRPLWCGGGQLQAFEHESVDRDDEARP